jgi:TPR repeat protein
VGVLYADGLGVLRDLRAAVLWFARAATKGHKEPKEMLLALASEGVPEAAAALHRLGVDSPLRAADAAVIAAGSCPLGDVEAQDAAIVKWAAPERTLAAMRAAAEAGDIAAQYALGECFRRGMMGAPQDLA